MPCPVQGRVQEHLQQNPITAAERAMIDRARAGDFTGFWHRDGDGGWERVR